MCARTNSKAGQRDQEDLSHFGYAQELFRNMGGFSNFAISFSIISILTGAVTLYGYGLEMGGPLEMGAGWPIATLFTLTVAASMAELCSAYPTSGALYHWASALGGPGWGWFVSWMNIFGICAAQAGINYSCAQFILPFLGLESSRTNLFLMFCLILMGQGLFNHWGVRIVAILNDFSVTVHIAGVLIFVGAIVWLAPLQPVGYLLEPVNSNGRSPYWWAFLLGLLQAQWTYTGFDASAQVAEETRDPRRHAPWGIVLSVAISGVVGFLLIAAMTLAIQDLPALLAMKDEAGNPVPAAIGVLRTALGARFGNALGAMASVAMWFCGLSAITSGSRALYSLARDGGAPGGGLLARVNPSRGTPGPAIWTIVAVSAAAMVWAEAIPVVTSLSTMALYLAYGIPVALGLRARLAGDAWPSAAVWSLGRWGSAVNWVAVVYIGSVCVILTMPPNELAGKTLAGVAAGLLVLWRLVVRGRFAGPAWSRAGHLIQAPREE
ncbi:MAG: amino acid permease [Acidobacteria bacterium]|nr:amino acid permease [Acidobacteriota bacterium]